ncbi:MAG: nicotinate-nucleotide adenylyltransferase [Thermodesulfovibrionales bacterium]|nr:nicotinate-nucleotide adenylyltransferase [Thermodesulfovibrionales bacterium]
MKIGIFGGTFNPIHYGHLRAAEEVRERFDLTKIIFIPSKDPPLKKEELLYPEHRYKMTELAISGNDFFEISDIEYKRPGKSYSVHTVEELRGIYPDTDLYFILGIDTFLDIPNWWNPERLVSLIDFIVISRPFFKFVDLLTSPYIYADKRTLERLDKAEIESYTIKLRSNREITAFRIPLVDISASEIRRLVREERSIKYLLPESVESYIIINKMYKKVGS